VKLLFRNKPVRSYWHWPVRKAGLSLFRIAQLR